MMPLGPMMTKRSPIWWVKMLRVLPFSGYVIRIATSGLRSRFHDAVEMSSIYEADAASASYRYESILAAFRSSSMPECVELSTATLKFVLLYDDLSAKWHDEAVLVARTLGEYGIEVTVPAARPSPVDALLHKLTEAAV